MPDTLKELRKIIDARQGADPENSYVARLFKRGRPKICQKVGEEASEVIIAALTSGKKDIIDESADLLFHLSMLWAECGVKPEQVMKELDDRMGISGLDEKAARKATRRDKKSGSAAKFPSKAKSKKSLLRA